eukprot:1157445-Pelagomonas_calceolata.AAC.15
MSREVFWDDFDGNAIGVDVGVKSLGMQQYGGITCKQVLHLRQPRSRSRRGRPFEELSALSPACYEENSRDDDADWKSRGSYKVPQRGRAQKWDRSKDAEDYTVEMAGKDGPAVREELRRAELQLFQQSLSELAAELLPQNNGSLPPIVGHVNS